MHPIRLDPVMARRSKVQQNVGIPTTMSDVRASQKIHFFMRNVFGITLFLFLYYVKQSRVY